SVLAQIVQFLRSKIKHGALIVRFRGGKVQRVAQTGVKREAWRCFPVVLHEVFLNVRARADDLALQINGELLHLSQQKAGQSIARAAHARLIGEQLREGEDTRRVRRLQDVEPLPAEVQSKSKRMRAELLRGGVHNFCDVGLEIGERVCR